MKEQNLKIGLGFKFTLHAWYGNPMPDKKQSLLRIFVYYTILLWYDLQEIFLNKSWVLNNVKSMHVFI